MIDIEEECSDSDHPEQSVNISSNITMVAVEFSLNEDTSVVPEEVQQVVRRVEAVVKNKEVAEALVKQLTNTLWHPSLSVVATLGLVPSLSNSVVAEQAGPKYLEEEAKPCVNLAISKIEDSTSRQLTMKTASIVKEDLNEGILKKKKVTGKTSDDRIKQHMLNYMIGKIELLDGKIRLTKGEQLLLQEEIEVLDQDILKLEDELEECRQSCTSTLGVVFPAMDIRLKSDLVKRSGVQSADKLPTLNHKNQTIVHFDNNQGGMLEHDQFAGEQRNAGIHVEELNPDDTMVETAKEGRPETLEVHINDELGRTHQNEPKTLRAGNNPVIEDESEMTGEEVLGLNFVIK